MKPRRVPFTVSATMLFLMIAFNSTPSDTAIHDPYRLSAVPQEDQEMRDLARWVVQARTERPRLFTPRDLDAVLTQRPQKLGLLSPEASSIADAARREQLAGLPY
ncbi:MAG TPA: hypothetical protein VH394_02630, partial [Thermoanaerobaculia bacterium]|nr:hypothetical protein [Thermoanaerobaculia bacterium]